MFLFYYNRYVSVCVCESVWLH